MTARSSRARDSPALAFAREGWISGARRPRIGGVTWMAPRQAARERQLMHGPRMRVKLKGVYS